MKTVDVTNTIRRALDDSRGDILAIDPDATTPGAALWTRHDALARAWGGDASGRTLATPDGARALLESLTPSSVVLVEAPLSGRSPFPQSLHAQAIVRGGWVWLATLAGHTVIQVPPHAWQRSVCPTGTRDHKAAYKALARAWLGLERVNEDIASALGILRYALDSSGLAWSTAIRLAC